MADTSDATTPAAMCTVGHVQVVAPFDTSRPGGLETYVRTLRDSAGPAFEIKLAETDAKAWERRQQWVLRAMTRPKLRWVARRLAETVGRSECERLVADCDVVHFVGTGWNLAGFPLLKAARTKGVPVTCWPAVHPGSWGDSALDVDLYRQMDAVFVQSDYEANHLTARGVPRDKFVRCGCAAPETTPGDGDRFRNAHGLGDRPIVLFIGRKSHGKGYHALREAIGDLAKQSPDITLVSIGRDVDPPYPSLPASIDLDLGAADEPTKHDALAACDVFALPSEAESFGIVYIEAWAYGKPVICGTAPASRELVERHNGGVATDGRPEEIASALGELLRAPSNACELGLSGLEAIQTCYSVDAVLNRHALAWSGLRSRR